MKYIKTYESIENNSQPQVGDYVLMNSVEKFKDYINITIGEIIEITYDKHIKNHIFNIKVKYTNIPQYIEDLINDAHFSSQVDINQHIYIKNFKLNRLVVFNKDKEKLEIILNTIKYNL